jgi:AmmeMemoRadiSam system protein A
MNDAEGATLLRLARAALETAFDNTRVAVPREPWLDEPRATFVTLRLREDDELRGCVGSVEARQPLGEAVIASARSAAFHDPRFAPLTCEELALVRIDVSVLSPLVPCPVASEADAHATLGRTRPGVMLSHGGRRGVLLPQVWESVPDPGEFLRHLKRKAGLAGGFWSPQIELCTFTCDVFDELGLRARHQEAS